MTEDPRDVATREKQAAHRKFINDLLAQRGWTYDGVAPRANGTVMAYKLRRLVDGHTCEYRIPLAEMAMDAMRNSEQEPELVHVRGQDVPFGIVKLLLALLVVAHDEDTCAPPAKAVP